MATQKRDAAVIRPNLGLYTTAPSISQPARALVDGLNFKVKNGLLTNAGLGWERFSDFTLNGPVVLIDSFFIRGLEERTILGTLTDLYRIDTTDNSVKFITPIYNTGTAEANGVDVEGTGTTWTTNVKAGDEIHFGAADQTDPDATWFEIDSVTDNDTLVLTTSAGVVADGVYTIRQRFTGELTDVWDTATFVNAPPTDEDLWFGTNGVDFIVKWNGLDDQVEYLSALGIRAKRLAVFNNMMIYGNLTQAGDSLPADIINSDPTGGPEAISSGLAEQFKVVGEVGEIIRMKILGDNLAIYMKDNDNIILTQFIGDPFIFVFRRASTAISALASRLIVDMGDYHIFMGKDSEYRFDGASVAEMGQQFYTKSVQDMDATRLFYANAFKDRENGSIYWAIPRTSDSTAGNDPPEGPEIATVDHYLEAMGKSEPMPISRREMPFTSFGVFFSQETVSWDTVEGDWDSQTSRWNDRTLFAAFPTILAGNDDGEVYTLNTSNLADGVELMCHVRFSKRATNDARMRALISRVYPFARDAEGTNHELNVILHLYDHEHGDATLSAEFPFDLDLPEGQHFVSTFRRARFYECEFASDSGVWEIEGYNVDIKRGGMR